MDFRTITDTTSKQYEIVNNSYIENGLLYYDGAICVALGSVYGEVGTIYRITLENGNQIKVIKADEKSDAHTYNGCNNSNGSILELIVDTETMDPFVMQMGDYNHSTLFNGNIVTIEKEVN